MKTVLDRTLDCLRLIYSPRVVFAHLARQPHWRETFVVLSVVTMAATIFLYPFTLKAAAGQLERVLPEEEISAVIQSMKKWYALGLVLVPPVLLGKWLLYSGLAWILGLAFGLFLEFRKLFLVTVYSSVAVVLESLYGLVILWARGLEEITGPADLQVAIGLNLLFDATSAPVFALLGNLNLFELWFVGLMATGIAVTHSCDLKRGYAIAIPVWATFVLVQYRAQAVLEGYTSLVY